MTIKLHKIFYSFQIILFSLCFLYCNAEKGPDPWDLVENDVSNTYKVHDDRNIPPDLRIYPKKERKMILADSSNGISEWFFRRILSIVLKGGQVKKNEDGSVDISLQMKLHKKEWDTLDEYLKTSTTLSEDKLRRSLGYIEQSIYEPSIPTKIILAWSDYIQLFLSEYKTEIVWTLSTLAACLLLFWLWKNMSHRNAVILLFIALYAYEVFLSYKEAEKKELEMFVSSLNSCKWKIWSSECEIPRPDLVVFLKHMNPTKIGVRMFTNIVSEPMIAISATVKTMSHGMTDGLWYPFNIIMSGILNTAFNFLLVIFLIMILFNFVLNIPFSFGILGSLVSVALPQHHRPVFTETNNQSHNNNVRVENVNTLSGPTLDKFLEVFSKALNSSRTVPSQTQLAVQDISQRPQSELNSHMNSALKRSASTGRLPELSSYNNHGANNVTKRNIRGRLDGSGDAF